MADKTGIEWCDATWNPIAGCSIVSPGCTNCYAMKMAARCEAMGTTHYAGTTRKVKGHTVWTGQINAAPDHILTQPLRWKRSRKVFVNSMSDLFAEGVPDEVIDRVFAVMALCPQHTFQVLTKRPARMLAYLTNPATTKRVIHEAFRRDCEGGAWISADHEIAGDPILPLPNVWLGVSVEDQTRADERIPILLDTPAAVRFVSAEPLLAPLQLCDFLHPVGVGLKAGGDRFSILPQYPTPARIRPALDWVIVGGESSPGARPMHPDWARQIRDDCAAAGVPFFFKQWGEWTPYDQASGEMKREILAAEWDGDRWELIDPRDLDDLTAADLCNSGASYKYGKRAAGRLLDGVEHNGMPG